MSRREALVTALAVFAIAVAVRIWAASIVVFPKPEDTAYYVMVARNILDGHGIVADAIWSYQTPPLEFPRHAFEVWLPLPTALALVPMALFGTSFEAAQWSSIVVGALVPVLAWRLAADVVAERRLPQGRARTVAVGSGLTAAVALPIVLHGALPDSTMPFAVLALGACLLMTRLVRLDAPVSIVDPRLLGLGACIGLAALTRNEAIWLGLVWLGVVAWMAASETTTGEKVRLVAVPAILAIAIYLPWAARDWLVFGSPLPGQAAANAFSVTGFDIFAWNDPPTLSRYLAVGPARLLEMRVDGLGHNLMTVLLLPGMPVSAIGLVALPWQGRDQALRPLLALSIVTFLVTSLVFPVATTWGTFLHAAGPIHVLLIVSAVLGLDALIAWAGRRRGWHRPVAWLGPALTVSASLLFLVVLLPTYGTSSAATARQYAAIEAVMADAGEPLGPAHSPVITDFPIWLADATGTRSLALPAETASDVVDLAGTFGAELVLMNDTSSPTVHGTWPGVLDEPDGTDPAVACFHELDFDVDPESGLAGDLGSFRAWRIECPPETAP